jgi:hypothetical protein
MASSAGAGVSGVKEGIGRIAGPHLQRWRQRLAARLSRWGRALDPSQTKPEQPPAPLPPRSQLSSPTEPRGQLPGVRLPLSMEQAVRRRNLPVLRREAADALAALGAAHALVASARFTELQERRQGADIGEAEEEELATMAADYLGWQSDQVRVFDALGMVLGMRVPSGSTLSLIDPLLRPAAEQHLASLAVEYQRRLLDQQFGSESAAAGETG